MPATDNAPKYHVDHSMIPQSKWEGEGQNKGHFSVETCAPPRSTLSANQQADIVQFGSSFAEGAFHLVLDWLEEVGEDGAVLGADVDFGGHARNEVLLLQSCQFRARN